MGETATAMANPQTTPAGESLRDRRVVLPGGVLGRDGACHNTVVLRELTGADEELLCDRGFESGAHQVTAFLARAIAGVPGLDRPVDEALTADMLIGDRDYLLLRLRQIEAGDHVHQVIRCPANACGKKVDVEFWISEIAVRRVERVLPRYRVELAGDDGATVAALVRLPSGADQQAVAPLIAGNPGAANTRLYSRIVEQLGSRGKIDEAQARALSLRARRQLAAFLDATCPGPDLYIDVHCPYCSAPMSYDFDLHGFFLRSDR